MSAGSNRALSPSKLWRWTTPAGVDGVADVHHVHLWQMEEHAAALDTHVVVEEAAWDRLEDVKRAIKAALKERFDIGHSTLEFEREARACDDAHVYGHG